MNDKDLTPEQKLAFKKLNKSIATRAFLSLAKLLGIFWGSIIFIIAIDIKYLNMSEGFIVLASLATGLFIGRHFISIQKKEHDRIKQEVEKILK